MKNRNYVLINDLNSAIERSGEPSRSFLRNLYGPLAEHLVAKAQAFGWAVVSHQMFQVWTTNVANQFCSFCLDPLMVDGPSRRPIRVTRVMGQRNWSLRCPDLTRISDGLPPEVGVIDDVAVSGETVTMIGREIRRGDSTVSKAILATATDRARATIRSALDCEILTFVSGSAEAVHLRDACPGVAFSGRPLERFTPVQVGKALIDVRVPPFLLGGKLWSILFDDDETRNMLRQSVAEMRSFLARRLGRPPRLSDTPILGPFASFPLLSPSQPSADTLF